jgi:holo-[acyl-carrier protein] synthase
MRIPFPFALSVGTDIVAIRRLIRTHTAGSGHLQRLAHRFLHPQEISDLGRRFPEWLNLHELDERHRLKIASWLAGRWAAKEAAKKAWGASLISFKDLRIEVLETGEVHILCQSYSSVNGDDAPNERNSMEQAAKLSISHDGDYAIATVIASPLHSEILAELSKRKAAADRK